jgi:hypothetical protein
MLRQALELAPVSKLMCASDAARTPELYFLDAWWWREALAEVLPQLLKETRSWPRGASCARTRSNSTDDEGPRQGPFVKLPRGL